MHVDSYNYYNNKNNLDNVDIGKPVPIRFYIENKTYLILLINFILPHLRSNDYSKIILSGHSNGMSAATMFAYILYVLTLTTDDRIKIPKDKMISSFITPNTPNLKNPNLSFNFIDIKDKIKENIYICDTAGFPCLFTNINEFNLFNNFYNYNNKKKYIHVISGLNNKTHQIYDQIACVESPYKNFGSIVFNINMSNKETNCFYLQDIFDSEGFIDNKFINYDKEKTDIHAFSFYRYLYNKYFHRKTKNDVIFNTYNEKLFKNLDIQNSNTSNYNI